MHVQSNAIITRSNLSRYYLRHRNDSNRKKKIDRVITALHFTAILAYFIAQAQSKPATSGSKCDTG